MSRRTEKVASLLQQELGSLINKLELPFLTTISKIEVSPDLKWSRIWVTVFSDESKHEDQVMAELKKNQHDMQQEINHMMQMKNVPKLNFVLDHSQQYVSHISKLLREVDDEQKS